MSTYIPGVTDTLPVPAPFQPDLSLVQQTMGTLQHRYDQGFAAINNAYNQVLQAPLSDPVNQSIRKTFLGQSAQRLKNLASADLSLRENQQVAEQVFAPFWEDEFLLKDASLTKWYNSELQEAYRNRDSSDEKIRSQYSDVAVRYLQNGLDQLKQADRDPGRYAQLEQRRFVPFKNMEAYLNDQAKEAGLKIEWHTTEGPYLVNTVNGTKSATAFEAFAHNMLGNNFTEQFRVMGVVEKEERLRQIKQLFPLVADKTAIETMGKEVVKELQNSFTQRQQTINTNQLKLKSAIAEYEKKPVLSDVQEMAYRTLLQQDQQLQEQSEAVREEAKVVDADQQQLTEWITSNPDGYFAKVMKERTVRGWSQARAANQQTQITINPVWKENNEINYRKQTLDLNEREYLLNKWKAENDVDRQTGNDKSKSGSSKSNKTVADPNPETAGRYDGRGTTDVTKVGNALQIFKERQQQRWNMAHNEILDMHMGVGSVLSTLGIPDKDAVRYMDMMKVFSTEPGIKGKFSGEDMQFFRNIGETLKKETGIDAGSGFYNARSALLEAARRQLEKKMKEDGSGVANDDLDMLTSYVSATWALQEHDNLESERKRLLEKKITSDPKTFQKILTQKKGTYDVTGVDDVVKDFKPIELMNAKTRDKMTLSPRQFAELYLNGQFKYLTQGDVEIGGSLYSITRFDGYSGWDVAAQFNDFYYDRSDDLLYPENSNSLQKKYGSSREQRELRDKLDAAVVPQLPEFQNEQGKLGFIVRYDLSDKTTGDVGARLINEAAQAANRDGIYIDGRLSDVSSLNQAVEKLAKMNEGDLEQYISTSLLKTVGINGRPSLEVVFKPIKSTDKTVIGEVDLSALSEKTIELDLNPNATGETLRRIRFNPGYYIYGSLLRGIPLQSDKMLEAAGFSFSITPDSGNDPQRALVRIYRKEFRDGRHIELPDIKEAFSFQEKNPDEIVRFMYGLFQQHLVKNLTLQSQYEQQHKQQLKTPLQIKEEYKTNARSSSPTR